MTEADRVETIEIVENLHRRLLPKKEKERLINRYLELSAGGNFGSTDPKLGRGRPAAAASRVAQELGISKSTVARAMRRDKVQKEPPPPKPHPEPDPFPPRRARDALRALQALDEEERVWVLDQMKGGAFD